MTRSEYIISLSAWNYYIASVSKIELTKLQSAFGTLGKALTEFQSIYSVFAAKARKRPYMPSTNEYKAVVEELRLRMEANLLAHEEKYWQEEIYFY